MEFEWDEAKRLTNLAKHGLDFARADILFEAPNVTFVAKTVGDEARWMATGFLDGIIATAIFTWRGNNVRLISLRKARHEEKRRYQALYFS